MIKRWREKQLQDTALGSSGSGTGSGSGLEKSDLVMGEKEIKREGFVLAEERSVVGLIELIGLS